MRISLVTIFLSFLRLGLTAFGGPAMVAYVRALSVEKNRWLDEETFTRGVTLCQILPGAIVVNLAAYVGLIMRGPAGMVVSFAGFTLLRSASSSRSLTSAEPLTIFRRSYRSFAD